jgi:FKBP-type peptidyl-prolyl cis-trans isomerase FkpA
MKKVNYVMLIIAVAVFTASCNKISYRKTRSGLVYKIFPSNGKDSLMKPGQIAKFQYVYKLNDSLLYSTYGKMPAYAKLTPLIDPLPYNLLELLPLMKKGDSSISVQMVDTLLRRGEQVQPPAKKGDRLTTIIKIMEVFPTDSITMIDYNAEALKDQPRKMKEQQEQQEKMEKEMKEQQAKEEVELEKSGEIAREIQAMESFLAGKKISAQKTGKGTFVHIEQQGTGPAAEDGKYVNVKYTGKHLDTDSTFQSSVYSFQLGMKKAISGWDEGLKLFKQGGKGTLYIPGFLCYGKNPPQGSPFKPFEPMKFDIELLEVSDKPISPKTP